LGNCAVLGSWLGVRTVIYPALVISADTAKDIDDALAVKDISRRIVIRTVADLMRANKKATRRSSVLNIVSEITIPSPHAIESFDAFIALNAGVIEGIVGDYQRQYGSIRVHVRVDAIFVRDVKDGQQRIPAYFNTRIHDVDPTQNLDLQAVAADLSAQADHWNVAAVVLFLIVSQSSCSVFLSIGLCIGLLIFPHISSLARKNVL